MVIRMRLYTTLMYNFILMLRDYYKRAALLQKGRCMDFLSPARLQVRLAELLARVHGLGAELFLDAQQLVVLGQPLRAARGAGLNFTSPEAHHQVGDEHVLGLPYI